MCASKKSGSEPVVVMMVPSRNGSAQNDSQPRIAVWVPDGAMMPGSRWMRATQLLGEVTFVVTPDKAAYLVVPVKEQHLVKDAATMVSGTLKGLGFSRVKPIQSTRDSIDALLEKATIAGFALRSKPPAERMIGAAH